MGQSLTNPKKAMPRLSTKSLIPPLIPPLDISGFNTALAKSESGGRYGIENSEGFAGKYQFGDARLADYKRATGENFTKSEFKARPELQERVQSWHISDIDNYMSSKGLTKFIGKTVGGVPVTHDSFRAMAHLGGSGGAEKFLLTGGKYNPADSNGTRLSDYGKRFANAPRSVPKGLPKKGPDAPKEAQAGGEAGIMAMLEDMFDPANMALAETAPEPPPQVPRPQGIGMPMQPAPPHPQADQYFQKLMAMLMQ